MFLIQSMDMQSVSNLELRRAVLGVLLLGARAMSVGEIERELRAMSISMRWRCQRVVILRSVGR